MSQGRSAAEVDAMARSDFEALADLFAKGVIGWFKDAANTFMVLDRLEALTATVTSLTGSRRSPKRHGFAEVYPHMADLIGGATPEDLSAKVLRWRRQRMKADPEYAHDMVAGGGYDDDPEFAGMQGET